jgi:Helicase associated domain
VPAVDMVAFIDPRHSKVDIAQATGRAMRKPSGLNKEVGYVVIPLFLDRRSGETLEEALERSEFDDVANVLNAMQEQDEELVQIIQELNEAKGRGETFDPRRLSEKIEVLGPSIELSALKSNICAEIVDEIGARWDEWYGLLTLYKTREGHCRVHRNHEERGLQLGVWVDSQRANKNLSEERRRRLDGLGFVWDPFATDWEEGFSYLKTYREREGNCDVPTSHVENGYNLGTWIVKQRSRKGTLSEERRHRLNQLGFVWAPLETDWEVALRCLKAYGQREGHCRVPKHHEENGFPLGRWVANRRSRAKSVPPIRRRQLDHLGFVWDVFAADWEEGFSHLKAYKEREGHCRVPRDYREDGFRLGRWVSTQRPNRNTLSEDRRQRLDGLGFVWDPHGAAWDNGFDYLKAYKEREGHCRVPVAQKEAGFPLGQWVNVQRTNKEKLTVDRRRKLDELGFVWDALTAQWEEGFNYLKVFKLREGHCRVPVKYEENGYRLGQWVGIQRANKDAVSGERRQRLDELGFVWNVSTKSGPRSMRT